MLGLILVVMGAGLLGCGSSEPTHEEGKNPFKARQETQKEKKQSSFMKPD
jgi:hypothetical protein